MKLKTRKRKQKAGQLVRYSQHTDWHRNWVPLDIQPLDCGANVFALLGYADRDTANFLAYHTDDRGLHSRAIRQMLNEAYGPGHEWIRIPNNYTMGQYLDRLQATIAWVGNGDNPTGIGHYVIVQRTLDAFVIIDPQMAEPRVFDIIEYMNWNPTNGIWILNSPNVIVNNHYRVTEAIVRRALDMPEVPVP